MHQTREQWLEAAMSELSSVFQSLGSPLPDRIRVSCAFTSGGTRKKAGRSQIGECWDSSRSGDLAFEIMVSPEEDDPVRVIAILAHELCHAAAGLKCGHRGAFAVLARGLKLEGPLTSTVGGDDFKAMVKPIIATLGAYPHAALDTSKRAKQGTRMLLCKCHAIVPATPLNRNGICGYAVRTTQRWLDVGVPHCPLHGAMDVV